VARPARAACTGEDSLCRLQRLAGNRALIDEAFLDDVELRGLWLSGYDGLTEREKLAVATRILAVKTRLGGVGPAMLRDLWKSFGPEMVAVAEENSDLWERSASLWARLGRLPVIEALKRTFSADVGAVAESYLDANADKVLDEIIELEDGLGGSPTGETAQSADDRVAALQVAANVVVRAHQRRQDLATTVVGYRAPDGGQSGSYNEDLNVEDDGSYGDAAARDPVYFDPSTGPADLEPEAAATWTGLKRQDDDLAAAIASLLGAHPSLFAMLRAGRLQEFVSAPGSGEARSTAVEELRSLLDDINAAWAALWAGRISPLDLHPIHRQLFAGKDARSGTRWSHPFYRWVGADAVADHDAKEFWKQIGLASASAAAFIVAELATGGMATFLFAAGGTAINALQIADDYERWALLDLAERARTGEEDRLVDPSQVGQAQLALGLDVAFAAIDLAGVARLGGRFLARGVDASMAGNWGVEAAGTVGSAMAARLRSLTPGSPDRVSVVEEAIDLLGVDRAAKLSGRSPGQLIALVGSDTEVARRILGVGFGDPGLPLEELLRGSFASGGAIPRVMRDLGLDEAIERLGAAHVLAAAGGLKALVAIVGAESRTAARLLRFRDQTLLDDVLRFGDEWLPGGAKTAPEHQTGEPIIVRTGTTGSVDNDLDLSFLGPNAGYNRAQTRAYLAGRLGVPVDALSKLLNCDFFVDPRRLHAYDALPAGLRHAMAAEQARFEEDLLLNRSLYEAEERGDAAAASMLRERMVERGVEEAYDPLTPEDVEDLYRRLDEWSGQLAAGAESPELVRKIGRAQARINAVEQGGYLTGGGTRRLVTDRDLAPLLGKAAVKGVDVEAVGAALDQLVKVYPLVGTIERELDASSLTGVLRSLAKYVARFADEARPALWDPKALDALFDAKSKAWDELWPTISAFEEVSGRAGQLLAEARGTAKTKLLDRVVADKDAVVTEARRTVDALWDIQWKVIDELRARCQLEQALGDTRLLLGGQDLAVAELRLRRLRDRVAARLADLPNLSWTVVAQWVTTPGGAGVVAGAPEDGRGSGRE